MKKNGKNHSFSNVWYVLTLVLKYAPLYFFFTVLFSIVQIVTPLNDTLIPKIIIDSLSRGKELRFIFIFILAGAAIRIITAVVFPLFFDYIVPKYENMLKGRINHLLMNISSKYDLALFENPHFYDTYARALKEADSRAAGIVASFGGLFTSLCYLSTLCAVIVYIDPLLILVCIVISVLTVFGNKKTSKIGYEYELKTTKTNRFSDYIKRVFYEPQYAKELRVYALSGFLLSKFDDAVNERGSIIKKRAKKILPIKIFLETLRQGILYSFIIIYIVVRIYHGYLSVGDFFALFTAAIQLSAQLSNMGAQFNAFYEHGLFAENLKAILTSIPHIEAAGNTPVEDGKEAEYGIQLKDVRFAYDTHRIFNDICFQIATNEKIAIVGRNGAGKTTLIKLLLRLYDPASGSITFNQTNYKDIPVRKIRKRIGVVFQDMQFFSLNIAENILLRPLSNNEEDTTTVMSALKKAGLLEKVQSLPHGIHSILTKAFDDEGVVLSGGELQKLALARVFASDCDIVILDEPSSALDPISEKEMFDFMYSAVAGKSMILITHRLSSVKMAHKIYFMEEGNIIEAGTHAELMQRHGKYYEMFNLQAANYIV